MPYVYSTLACDNAYTFYEKDGSNKNAAPHSIHKVKHKILIKGGTAVAQSTPERGIYTPYGVVTEISEQELSLLLGGLTVKEIMEQPLENHAHKGNPVFKKHLKNGFLRVDDKKLEVEKAVATLESKDLSAQKTDKDFEETKGAAKVKKDK